MQAELVQIEADMEAFVSLREMQPFDQCFVDVGEKADSIDATIWKSKFAEVQEKLKVYCGCIPAFCQKSVLTMPQMILCCKWRPLIVFRGLSRPTLAFCENGSTIGVEVTPSSMLSREDPGENQTQET
jgi:hypothetical protein